MVFKKLLKKLNEDKVRKTDEYDLELSHHLSKMVASIQQLVGESDDISQQDFKIGRKIPASLFFIEGLCKKDILEKEFVKPLMQLSEDEVDSLLTTSSIDSFVHEFIALTVHVYESFDEAMLPLMSGQVLLVIDGKKKLILLDIRGFEQRGVEEPQTEVMVRGPRDGFNETLQTNIVLIRRRIRDPNLTIQLGQVGRRTKKDFAIMYIKGVADEDLVEEVRYRVSCVDIDDVPETGTIEQLIEDNVLSPFPQILHTERPDRTASSLFNGQVVILLDGTPFSLIAPITLHQLLISPEDYYERWQIGTLVRILRWAASFIALFLPALYIAMVSFHQGMIPTTMALSLAGSREGVPFPAVVEAFIMEGTLELLREAGTRLPRPVGQTIGIVGGLVIGEAAVQAGIVSPIMVIVVAVTAISSFALPYYNVSIAYRILRFSLMIAASIFGLFGIIVVYIAINIHLVGLSSFGSYYLSPFAPFRFVDWLDLVIRAPLSLLRSRKDEPTTLDNQKQNL